MDGNDSCILAVENMLVVSLPAPNFLYHVASDARARHSPRFVWCCSSLSTFSLAFLIHLRRMQTQIPTPKLKLLYFPPKMHFLEMAGLKIWIFPLESPRELFKLKCKLDKRRSGQTSFPICLRDFKWLKINRSHNAMS